MLSNVAAVCIYRLLQACNEISLFKLMQFNNKLYALMQKL